MIGSMIIITAFSIFLIALIIVLIRAYIGLIRDREYTLIFIMTAIILIVVGLLLKGIGI